MGAKRKSNTTWNHRTHTRTVKNPIRRANEPGTKSTKSRAETPKNSRGIEKRTAMTSYRSRVGTASSLANSDMAAHYIEHVGHNIDTTVRCSKDRLSPNAEPKYRSTTSRTKLARSTISTVGRSKSYIERSRWTKNRSRRKYTPPPEASRNASWKTTAVDNV